MMSSQPAARRSHDAPLMLVVDDDPDLRKNLARAFERRGFIVQTAVNAEEAVDLAKQESPEYAVVDLRMPGRSGLELIRDLKRIDPQTNVVVLTGYGSIATSVEAMRLGASNYVPKPADADDVLAAFARGEGNFPAPEQPDPTPSLARAEWEHIHRVLADCEGNLSEAARRLDVHRRTLQRKLRKLAP